MHVALKAPFLISAVAPDSAPALLDGDSGRWTSYGELRLAVDSLAGRLAEHRKGLVLLPMRQRVSDVVAYVAAITAGHTVMLLSGDAAIDILARSYQADWIWTADEMRRVTPAGEVGTPLHPDHSLLLSTSGSTGSCKFVSLRRVSVEHNAAAIRDTLAIDSAECALAALPLHYSYGLSVLNSHLAAGARVVLTSFGVLDRVLWETAAREGATSVAGVPFTYQTLRRLGMDYIRTSSIRTMTQAGGRLAPDYVAAFHAEMDRKGGRFLVMYGQTEATARISVLQHQDIPRKRGSVGRPLPGGTVRVKDPGPDGIGELVYEGPNVMLGYVTDRQMLQQGDQCGGSLQTGDIGRVDEEGFIFISGRSRRIAKIAGTRVSLDEIEGLLQLDGPAAVIGTDDQISIFCVSADREGLARLPMALAEKTGFSPASFRVRYVDRLPLLVSGKVDYQALGRLM
jgi:acyl-coenzyme A synthetase/AMP-(fatty) acid ligase